MKIHDYPALRGLILFLITFFGYTNLDSFIFTVLIIPFLGAVYFLSKNLKTLLVVFFFCALCLIRFSFSEDKPQRSSLYQVEKIVKSNDEKTNFIGCGESKVLFYLKKENEESEVFKGDVFFYGKTLKSIPTPDSLNGFIYADYLASIGVDSIAYLKEVPRILYRDSSSVFYVAQKIRGEVVAYLNSFSSISPSTRGFTIAILTGDKSFLTEKDKKIFRDGGVVHVLAISGLHVGIFYFTLYLIFGKVLRLPNKLLFFLISVLLIGYAFLAGLSPSVVRAVIMFGLIHLGKSFLWRTNTLNIVFASACLMLFYNPELIYDIGFQLSYSAVLGIVLILQHTSFLILVKSKLLKPVWTLFLVGVAAFVFTAPILSFHFEVINFTSLWASLIVVPLILILMYLAFGVLISFPFPVISELVYKALDFLYQFVVSLIEWTMEYLSYVVKFHFNLVEVFVFFLILVPLLLKKFKALMFSLLVCCVAVFLPANTEVKLLKHNKELDVKFANDYYSLVGGERLVLNQFEFIYNEGNSLEIKGPETSQFIDFNVNKYQSIMIGF